jgi:GTP-binding protein EngB required for normal cell division
VTRERQRGAAALLARTEALHWFLDAVDGVVPEERIAAAKALVEHSHERLERSRGHTVVALAGGTGGGKSSLFNAVCRVQLSAVGVRRPTTHSPYACVWETRDSEGLLDWLGIPADRRYARESLLDGEDEAPLRGLVLLDLPDFDSVVEAHRAEVDRLLTLVDLVVWVTDPQKYADQVVHEHYLRAFHRHRDVMVVVLNQADRLSPIDAARCVADLRHLLESDGLAGIPVFATSAVAAWPGIDELRGALEKAVSGRQAALRRLDDNLTDVISDLGGMVGPQPAERGAEEALVDALARAAGVATVAEVAGRAYRRRAGHWLRWLPVRLPWRGQVGVAEPVPTQPAAVGLAVRAYSERVTAGLPEPWPETIDAAARAHLRDLPGALDRALLRTDLGATRTPWWWPVVTAGQWLLSLAAVAGVAWSLIGLFAPAFGASGQWDAKVGLLLAAGALLAGSLLRLLLVPVVAGTSRLVRDRAQRRLRASVFEVTRNHVVGPVRDLLGHYTRAGAALAAAGTAAAAGNGEPDDPDRAAVAATPDAGRQAPRPRW